MMKRFAMLTAFSLLLASSCSKKEEKAKNGVESSKVGEQAPAVEATPETMPTPGMGAEETQAKDIVDTAIADGRFTTLVTAVQAAGLVDTLKGEGPLTLFAPSDEAFKKLPAGTVEGLLQDPEKLAAILKRHVVPGKVMAKDIGSMQEVTALDQSSLPIDTSAGIKIGDATVEKGDIEASNGVIHVIDTVLLPK